MTKKVIKVGQTFVRVADIAMVYVLPDSGNIKLFNVVVVTRAGGRSVEQSFEARPSAEQFRDEIVALMESN